jgi:hypothetical protein
MRKSIIVGLAAFAALALSVTQLVAAVISPIGLSPGSPYQLIFVTADGHDAMSTTEAPYNTFVAAEAALNPLLPSATWTAVTSTADGTNANVNAPSVGLPVYNTAGQLVATSATGLYTAPLVNAVSFDQFGGRINSLVWTGSSTNGLGTVGNTLGTAAPFSGVSYTALSQWIHFAVDSPSSNESLYALSSTLTSPAPEPATITLLGSAFLLIGGMRLLRWRNSRR